MVVGALRYVVHESHSIVEKVESFEKSSEDLGVVAVQPLSASFYSVLAANDGEIVPYVGAPENFINGRLQEKWLAEAESKRSWAIGRTYIRVRHALRVGCVAGPIFACVGEMCFVEFGSRNCAEPVSINCLDL